MLSYNDPSLEKESNSTKMLLTELASFRMAVDNDEQLKNRSTYYFAGLEDSMRYNFKFMFLVLVIRPNM